MNKPEEYGHGVTATQELIRLAERLGRAKERFLRDYNELKKVLDEAVERGAVTPEKRSKMLSEADAALKRLEIDPIPPTNDNHPPAAP